MSKQYRNLDISIVFALINIVYLNGCMYTFLQKYALATYLGFASFFIWLLLSAAKGLIISKRAFILESVLLICFCYLLLNRIYGLNSNLPNFNTDYSNIIYIVMISSTALFYLREGYSRERKIILKVWFIDTIASCIYTIFRLQQYPLLSRYISTGDASSYIEGASTFGVMTFSNAYGLVLFVMILTCMILARRGDCNKRILLAAALLMLFTIIKMAFTISILLAISGIAIAVFNKLYKGKNRGVWIILFSVLILIIAISFSSILNFFTNLSFTPYSVKERLIEINTLINYGNMTGSDFAARIQLYSSSIDAIIANNFCGKVLFGNGTIGRHSEILDMIASYGVFYFLLITSFFLNYLKYIKDVVDKASFEWYKLTFLLFLLESTINTSFWPATMVSLLLIIPFMLVEYSEEKKICYENCVD